MFHRRSDAAPSRHVAAPPPSVLCDRESVAIYPISTAYLIQFLSIVPRKGCALDPGSYANSIRTPAPLRCRCYHYGARLESGSASFIKSSRISRRVRRARRRGLSLISKDPIVARVEPDSLDARPWTCQFDVSQSQESII